MTKKLRRVIAWVIGSVLVVVILVVGLGAYLMPTDPLEPSDAIVVISGGGPERLAHGEQLFRDGFAKTLILAGDAQDPLSPSNAESMRAAAVADGIPDAAILVEPTSRTTYENADRMRDLLADDTERIILVTSAYHQRRALEAFRTVYPELDILNSPAPVDFFTPWGWWQNAHGRRLFFSEYGKLLYILVTGKHDRS